MKHSPGKIGPLLREWAEEFQSKCKNPCPLNKGMVRLIGNGTLHFQKAKETQEYVLVKAKADLLGLNLSDCTLIGLACTISSEEEALMVIAYIKYATRAFDFGSSYQPITFMDLYSILEDRWPNKLLYSTMWIRQKGQFMNQDFDNLLQLIDERTFDYVGT